MKLQHQIDRLLARRASEWLQILETEDEAQRAEFVAWLKQSPLHIQEFLEATYTDRILAHVDPDRQEDLDRLLATIAPQVRLLNASAVGAGDPKAPSRPATARSWAGTAERLQSHVPRPRLFAVAVAVVVAVAIATSALYLHVNARGDYATRIGEQRTVKLADQTTVTMNTDSRIEVRLGDSRRDVDLLQGEALFAVAHDAKRPFIVHTRAANVRAVGTQFDVYEKPTGTVIAVLGGRVMVTRGGANLSDRASEALPDSANATPVVAGQEAFVSMDGSAIKISSADVTRAVAWRERRIVFQNAPLEDIVFEFNRYNQAPHFRVDNVPAGSHHYSGIFNVTDPDSLADLLSREPDLSVAKQENEIVIGSR